MDTRNLIPHNMSLRLAARRLFATIALLALPLAAWADDDDKPVPLDPKTAAMQNRTIGIILLIVVLAGAWYYLRRWQILRGGSQVHGTNRNQD